MANQTCHYNIAKNDKYGRYLIANKDLDSGDLIFTDTPFAIGPKPGKFQLVYTMPTTAYIYICHRIFSCPLLTVDKILRLSFYFLLPSAFLIM